MLKRILIPLDPGPYTEKCIELGCIMANRLDAELTGMVILDIPGIEKSVGPVPMGGLYYADKLEAQKQKDAQDHIDRLLGKFKTTCQSAGVRYQVAETQGSPSERILAESNYYDAVLIGMRTFFHFESQSGEGDSLEDLLDHSITPIYAVPKELNLPDFEKENVKVCIAFDGSFPAGRALQRFAQLAMSDFMEVTLVTSNVDTDLGNHLLDQAEAFLNAHGFENITKLCTQEPIIKTIDQNYLDTYHVFVVGAHSKHGLFDFMLGGLTRHLLKIGKRPVLIGQ